jgi:hypothetical protein
LVLPAVEGGAVILDGEAQADRFGGVHAVSLTALAGGGAPPTPPSRFD